MNNLKIHKLKKLREDIKKLNQKFFDVDQVTNSKDKGSIIKMINEKINRYNKICKDLKLEDRLITKLDITEEVVKLHDDAEALKASGISAKGITLDDSLVRNKVVNMIKENDGIAKIDLENKDVKLKLSNQPNKKIIIQDEQIEDLNKILNPNSNPNINLSNPIKPLNKAIQSQIVESNSSVSLPNNLKTDADIIMDHSQDFAKENLNSQMYSENIRNLNHNFNDYLDGIEKSVSEKPKVSKEVIANEIDELIESEKSIANNNLTSNPNPPLDSTSLSIDKNPINDHSVINTAKPITIDKTLVINNKSNNIAQTSETSSEKEKILSQDDQLKLKSLVEQINAVKLNLPTEPETNDASKDLRKLTKKEIANKITNNNDNAVKNNFPTEPETNDVSKDLTKLTKKAIADKITNNNDKVVKNNKIIKIHNIDVKPKIKITNSEKYSSNKDNYSNKHLAKEIQNLNTRLDLLTKSLVDKIQTNAKDGNILSNVDNQISALNNTVSYLQSNLSKVIYNNKIDRHLSNSKSQSIPTKSSINLSQHYRMHNLNKYLKKTVEYNENCKICKKNK